MKNYSTKIISILLAVLIIISLFSVNVSASSSQNEIETSTNSSWQDKLSSEVLDEMKSANKEDKIPVWIWFSDIDHDKVDKVVEKDTGLNVENISVSYSEVPDELVSSLENISEGSSDANKEKVANQIEEYIKTNKSNLEKEKSKTNKYVKAKRKTSRDFYVQKNTKLVKDLKITDNEMLFQSQLTPSVIAELTSKQIKSIAKSSEVVWVDYYNQPDELPPLYENYQQSMNVPLAREHFGLTGEGVNVLMNDHGCVRSDYGSFSDIIHPENVVSIVNGEICSITDTSVPCGEVQTTHPNLIAGTMQAYAEDVNIYSTGYGSYSDIEWALLNCDIDLINGSVNYGTFTNYYNDSYAKWFDALVSTYNVTLIASAGNSESWQSYGWPNVISPSSGFNSIAVGAYYSNGTNLDSDRMHNYRYNPTESNTQVCFKPDVVASANDTSRSAPSLSGIIAMMIELKPSLAAQPELIKAIVMASCQRKVDPAAGTEQESMFSGLTQRQGAGAVDAYRAISIVMQGNYGINEISNGSKDINFVQSGDGNNINVSLAWLRENTSNNASTLDTSVGTLQELEMEVFQGNTLMGESSTTHSGKQMVYFTQREDTDQYRIHVTKTSSNNESVRFAYAWSTEETAGKHLVLSTSNDNGIISQQEASQQIANANVFIDQTAVPFTISFDDTVSGIGANAINHYSGLTSVIIPGNVTSVGENAFAGNSNLKSVIIGSGINSIGQRAFKNCTSLKYVYFHSLIAPNIYNEAFENIASSAKGYIKNRSTGYMSKYDDLSIFTEENAEDIRTIYFTNNYVWNNLRAYLWKDGSAENNEWTGVPMKFAYTNYLGQGVFSIEVDYSQYDMIIFNDADTGAQTVDIGLGADGIGYCLSGSQTNGKWNVSTFTPDVRTIYFENNYVWNNLKAYLWKNGTSQNNSWPGVPMTFAYTNSSGYGVFSLTFDCNEYDRIIFNDGNGQAQTVDISVGSDGTGYRLTGAQTNGKWNVSTFNPDVRTVYFTNNYVWNNLKAYLWKDGTSQNNIWPGVSMTYASTNYLSQGVFSITFDYNEYDMIIFNDGNGQAQTVDISVEDSGIGYYLTGDKDGSKWLVGTYKY